jgi:hypothetical protein
MDMRDEIILADLMEHSPWAGPVQHVRVPIEIDIEVEESFDAILMPEDDYSILIFEREDVPMDVDDTPTIRVATDLSWTLD